MTRLIAIGCSTGGPNALESIFARLRGPFRLPIVIVQHMPPQFTATLAKRLGDLCQAPCGEAVDGDPLVGGRVYVAPGGSHLSVAGDGRRLRLALDEGPLVNSVRPAVDRFLLSLPQAWARDCLLVVLTGMGEDGRRGAEHVKRCGGRVVIESRASAVVWGMPGAVHAAGAFDAEASLPDIAAMLSREVA